MKNVDDKHETLSRYLHLPPYDINNFTYIQIQENKILDDKNFKYFHSTSQLFDIFQVFKHARKFWEQIAPILSVVVEVLSSRDVQINVFSSSFA